MSQPRFSLEELRNSIQDGDRSFWRSLEELADTDGFQEWLREEIPQAAMAVSTNRRDFLKLTGAALAMVSLSGCTQAPREKIVPYVVAPEEIVPGKPLFYATAMQLGGYARGVLVESHIGRPTKVEGNPDHPASLGATDSFAQAAVLSLYDPDRAEVVTQEGDISTWERFAQALSTRLASLSDGQGLFVLTETSTSPTLHRQMQALLAQYPQASWHQYDPINQDAIYAGTEMAFGRPLNPVYDFSRAERIVSLDADFLWALPGSLRHAREFTNGRQAWNSTDLNRLYVVESAPTITGSKADHRLPMRPEEVDGFVRVLARSLGVDVETSRTLSEREKRWVAVLSAELLVHRERSLVVVGDSQPPAVHAMVHAINDVLGNVGNTVDYTEPISINTSAQSPSMQALADAMARGAVDTLLILGPNPVYTAPADSGFAELLAQVPFSVHHGLYYDETAALCTWQVPATHFLESWSDARAYDGTASIVQPLIAPLFQGRTIHELLSVVMGQSASSHDIVKAQWESHFTELENPTAASFDAFWQKALHDGVIEGTRAEAVAVSLQPNWQEQVGAQAAVEVGDDTLTLIFRPDPSVWDGRFANNAWLQELPKPLTTITWDNAALLSPATADRLGLSNEDLIELRVDTRTLTVPVWIMPGHANDTVSLTLGYGHAWRAEISRGLGFNAYALRTASAPWFHQGVQIERAEGTYPLATTQNHYSLEGRDFVRSANLDEYIEHPDFAQSGAHHGGGDDEPPSLYGDAFTYEDGYSWGMVIDLNACVGCNACMIACQVENNIPTVGKEGVARGREMHWITVDQYYQGDPEEPLMNFQPRPCMHCEMAPCELVCPVEATVHNDEGLNQMIYNRCVGTRYCSNNCPYKVRRFNFFNYVEGEEISLLNMWRNPDVTVRTRGVMEKCTYCVQRINAARIEADTEDRLIRAGEVRTACQTVCPAQAIAFGNLNNEEEAVTHLKHHPLNYQLLEEYGTRPRTTYLAQVRNPNPTLEGDGPLIEDTQGET